jgi:nitrous oxide reductase accessory protein NosL
MTAKIRCGNLEEERGMCEATWMKPSGAECEAEYAFYAIGSQLRSADGGTLAACTPTSWLCR